MQFEKIKTMRTSKRRGKEEGELAIELQQDIQLMRYYLAPDDDIENAEHKSFLALTTTNEATNTIRTIAKNYNPGSHNQIERFIVLEFPHREDLQMLIDKLALLPYMVPFADESARLDGLEAKNFCGSLLEDSRSSNVSSDGKRSSKRRAAAKLFVDPPFLAGKDDNEVVLTYPFGGDKNAIEKAAEGLQELGDFPPTHSTNEVSTEDGPHSDGEDDAAGGRRHYLMISAGDCRRLAPGIFLNDTLIDFFMQWYVFTLSFLGKTD